MSYPTFSEVFFAHRELVADKWVNYLDVYEQHLRKYIEKKVSTLEIGVQNGGSIQIMNKYLINADVHGIDIDSNILSLGLEEEATLFCFNATDPQEIEKHLCGKEFEVIIDDGSHYNRDIISSFRALFSKLKPGGVYMVEDIQTSYWTIVSDGGVRNPNSATEFFKSLIDLVNFFHIMEKVGCDESLKEERAAYIMWIDSIQFYDNMIVVTKSLKARTAAYKRFLTGDAKRIEALGDSMELSINGYKQDCNKSS